MIRPIERDPFKIELAKLMARHRENIGRPLSADEEIQSFLARVSSSAQSIKTNQTISAGLMGEDLFRFLATSMGKVTLIKDEDSGELSHGGPKMQMPDFQVHTEYGHRFLVEVKHFYQKRGPLQPFEIQRPYLRSLRNYSEKVGLPLKLAIYWRRMNTWTLVDPRYLESSSEKNKLRLSFGDAYLHNEMCVLGDFAIGVGYPMSLQLFPDIGKPVHTIETGPEGAKLEFTVGESVYLAMGQRAVTPSQSTVLHNLFWFGSWPMAETRPILQGGKLEMVEYSCAPRLPDDYPDDRFPLVGHVSSIASNFFDVAYELRHNLQAAAEQLHRGFISHVDMGNNISLPMWKARMLPKNSGKSETGYLEFSTLPAIGQELETGLPLI